MYLNDTFAPEQFACHDGSATPAVIIPRLKQVHEMLMVLKAELAQRHGKPAEITLVSGYRSPSWNAKQGGEKHSEHMRGHAADIKVDGIAPDDVADLADKLQTSLKIPMGGVGRYDTFTHVDIRGYHARWDKRSRKGKNAKAA